MQYNATQYNAAQCSTIQDNTSAVQFDTSAIAIRHDNIIHMIYIYIYDIYIYIYLFIYLFIYIHNHLFIHKDMRYVLVIKTCNGTDSHS